MTNYLDATKHLNDAISVTDTFLDKHKKMMLNFSEDCRNSILSNIQNGGNAEDTKSATAFVSFMSIINLYLHQELKDEIEKLYFDPPEKSIDYGRRFYERLKGK